MTEWLQRVFPIRGKRFSIELVADEERGEHWLVTLRLVIHDEAGQIRDVKEQQIYFLPRRHRTPRGMELVERVAARIREMDPDTLELLMPHDLFFTLTVLDTELSVDAMMRALDDPRSLRILETQSDAVIDPDRVAPPVLCNPELEDRIAAGEDAYAVYGDWLAERGDPRGELIAIALAREVADDEALRARERALFDEYAFEWLGQLAWAPVAEATVTWRRGFLDAVRFGVDYVHDERGYVGSAFEIRELARLPGTRFVQTVELWRKEMWDDEVFVAIGEGLRARTLSIRTPELSEAGNVEPAYPGLATLRELRIESRAFELGAVDLPALRSLELVTRGLTRDNLASVLAANCPELERLVLWLGETGLHDCDVELADLDALLATDRFPKLRELGLCGGNIPAVLERTIGTPLLARLKVLDAAGGYLDGTDVYWVMQHASAFAHLEALLLPTGNSADNQALEDLEVRVIQDERYIPVYE